MFCRNCGKHFPDDTQFCPDCGKRLEKAAPAKPFGTLLGAEKPKKSKVKKISLGGPIAALAASVVVLAASVVFLLNDGGTIHAVTGEPVTPTPGQAEEISYNLSKIEKTKADTSKVEQLSGAESSTVTVRKEIEKVEETISGAEEELCVTGDENGNKPEYETLTPENLYRFLSEIGDELYELEEQGLILDYERNDSCIVIELPSGGAYVYLPTVEGTDAGTASSTPDLNVATYQPCLSGYSDDLSSYMKLIDQGAGMIDDNFAAYTFDASGGNDADYNDAEVTPGSCVQFGQYHIVLWHGHGAYSDKFGSLLVIGTERSAENDAKFKKALDEKKMFYTDNGYLVGADFFESYLEDGALDNCIVYLGTCSSAVDSRLGDALIAKGAVAVYGNKGVIHTVYNLQMINAVCEGLCTKYSDGGYYSVSDALQYAKDAVAEHDSGDLSGTEVVLNTVNAGFALDWYEDKIEAKREIVLVLDTSGSMDGTPLNETKEAAHKFVDTVLDYQAMIGLVSYNSSARLETDFTRKQTALNNAIDNLYTTGRTNTDAALGIAEEMLMNSDAEKKIIVLMTDGLPNEGRTGESLISYAKELQSKGIYIYTLGFFQNMDSYDIYDAQYLLEGMASDGCHYEVDDAEQLVYFFGDIADQINGQKYIYVKIACPVDVTVKCGGETLCSDDDKLSTRTSFGTLSFENVEGDENDKVKILRLKDGTEYDIQIEGTGKGKMDYTIGFMSEDGEYSDFRKFKKIDINRDTVIDTVASSSAEETVLQVDEDGDGKYDVEYSAGRNGRGEVVTHTMRTVMLCVGGAALLTMCGSTAVVALRAKRKKAAEVVD